MWIALIVGPILYSVLFPKSEFREIVQKLEVSGSSDLGSDTAIQQAIPASGRLRKAVQISFYSEITITLQHGKNLSIRRSQAGYVAWFENRHKPTLLLIQEIQADDSAKTYEIDEGDAGSLVRGFALPLIALITSLYMVRRKRSMPPTSPDSEENLRGGGIKS